MILAEVVSEVVDPYRVGLAARVTIAAELPAGLPLVRADRMLVGRALTNVIENALHAMPAGGALTIGVEATPEGFVSLTVTDTGVGMDADALAKIFEPYFSTKATGTGLGCVAKRNTGQRRFDQRDLGRGRVRPSR
jgi:signal transduction histidine kinase